MGLFSSAIREQIDQIAAKSNEQLKPADNLNSRSMNDDLNNMSKQVIEYFKDSPAILITSKDDLHDYVDKCIKFGYAGIDTETTGLDRLNDWVVGASLYVPGMPECYIPMKHLVPIFETPYKNQLSYEEVAEELNRLVDGNVKLIFANADFDLAMTYHSLEVDLIPAFYYDVISAWRALKENEPDNALKVLYAKYVMKGKADPKKFSDFFSPKLFPYCKPEVAKLYAANDAKITYELFLWQLPFITIDNDKCKKNHLEKIANLIWNIEFPMVRVCADLHRRGIYLDDSISGTLHERYTTAQKEDEAELARMIQELIDEKDIASNRSRPFATGKDFNPNSNPHVKYLVNKLLGSSATKFGKDELKAINKPVTDQILKVRGDVKLIGTYVDKMPRAVGKDHRIHACFKSMGAACITGDSIIPTPQGYFTISDICQARGATEGSMKIIDDLTIYNKDQVKEEACGVIRYTDVPTIRVETECGFVIEGTFNHPIMVSSYVASDEIGEKSPLLSSFWDERRFKRLDQISIGDFVEIPCNYEVGPKDYIPTNFVLHPPYQTSKTVAKFPEFYDEDFAEFLGMYHADGGASFREGTYTISLSNRHEQVIKRFEELGLKLFNVPASHYTKQACMNEVETYLSCMQIKDLDRILSHGKQYKKIPDVIWISPRSVINAYIRGLCLDSSVYYDENGKSAFHISIINEFDARMIQMHLASQGILCYWGHNENKGGWRTPQLSFNPDNYMLFRDTIGFIESRKYIETQPCSHNKYWSRRINNSFRLKVKSITSGFNTVYDLHVPESHSFISNGFISHNTGRMSSESPNLQNVPSHALDIRHMFRATPEQTEVVKCKTENNEIKLTLSPYDSVPTPSGKTEIRNLKQNDIVILKEDEIEVKYSVSLLEVAHGKATLIFRKEGVID